MADMNSMRVLVLASTGQGGLASTEVFHVGVAGRNLLVQSVGCVGQEVLVFMDGPPLGGHATPRHSAASTRSSPAPPSVLRNFGVRRPWAIKPSSTPCRVALAPHVLAAGCSSRCGPAAPA